MAETPQALEDWFLALAGNWSLERTMSNGAIFSGRASFVEHAPGAVLVMEEGKLALSDGNVLAASRTWNWQLHSPDTLVISYTGERAGELYHRVPLALIKDAWQGAATHLCGQDTYAGDYRLGREQMSINQVITGPAKDLAMKTRFFRY